MAPTRPNRKRPAAEETRPSATDARIAREAVERLAKYRSRKLRLKLCESGNVEIQLPAIAVKLLVELLSQVGQGHSVTLVATHGEMTTQEAADLLGVSRPFLVGLLDTGAMPSRRVGSHRRVKTTDVMAYRESSRRRRRVALDELAREAQELRLGY